MAEITELNKMNNSQFLNQFTNTPSYLKNNVMVYNGCNQNWIPQLIKETPRMGGIQFNNIGYNTLSPNNSLRINKFNDNLCFQARYQKITSLGRLFFSGENFNSLWSQTDNYIKKYTKIQVELIKNDNALVQYMLHTFNNFAEPTIDCMQNLKIINKIVLNSFIPDVISNMLQQDEYIKNLDKPFELIALPVNTSVKGRKANPDYIHKITNF